MIVIHVGLKKCGSASLQFFLSENELALEQFSVAYPKIGRVDRRAHHNFAYEIQRHRRRFKEFRGTLAQCAEYWKSSPCRVMALSSEVFEDTETRQALKMKRSLLRGRGGPEDFQIYLVLRDLVDLMPSSYAQKVKYTLHEFDFDSFFGPRMTQRRVQYFETAKRWADAFGWENLQVRVLESAHLLNGDIVEDFLHVCGVTMTTGTPELKKTGIQNVAPGWRVLEATRALRSGCHGLPPTHPLLSTIGENRNKKEFGVELGECAAAAGEHQGWNSERGQYLTRDQAQHSYETYRKNILRLNEKLSQKLPMPPDLDARGFSGRDFLPDVSRISPRELSAFYDEVWELLQERIAEKAAASPA